MKRRAPDLGDAALEKAALHYLERFAASSEHLRRVLTRRIRRAAMLGEIDAAAASLRVDALIERYLAAGLLDDQRFASAHAEALQRRGTSRHRIRQRLAAKGVAREVAREALAGLGDAHETSELAAACALVRRRRLGPFRAPGTREANRSKDLASLARAGFSLDIARRALSARDPDALQRMARGEET